MRIDATLWGALSQSLLFGGWVDGCAPRYGISHPAPSCGLSCGVSLCVFVAAVLPLKLQYAVIWVLLRLTDTT